MKFLSIFALAAMVFSTESILFRRSHFQATSPATTTTSTTGNTATTPKTTTDDNEE